MNEPPKTTIQATGSLTSEGLTEALDALLFDHEPDDVPPPIGPWFAGIDMEAKRAPLTTEQKLEIGQMLREGVSQAGIEVVIESWFTHPIVGYAAFVEYGKPPTNETNVVDGSIVEPITDEGRLLK